MKLEFEEYRVRRIINVHKHVDGPWFWGKYTAHPYIGCRSGCIFCYERGSRYLGGRDPNTFDTLIKVKVNAVDRMRVELPRLEHEVISCGDWQQPAEGRYRLSRQMLEVVYEFGFPLFIVERSPLLTRDLDLLVDIQRKTWVGVLFSISNMDPTLKRVFEPRSPGVRRRLQAMQELAEAGILVGTSMMPVIPFFGDDLEHLEEMVTATKDHGGSVVLGGGMTMDGVQAQLTLEAVRQFKASQEARWRKMYRWEPGGEPAYGPPRAYNARLGIVLRELCEKHGLLDRLPRYIQPGPLAINKRIAEQLFLKTYDLELEQAGDHRIWAYRKAAWTVDELPESVAGIFEAQGEAGLIDLPAIGGRIAGQIASWLQDPEFNQADVEQRDEKLL
jgi:DNA repair photolyase